MYPAYRSTRRAHTHAVWTEDGYIFVPATGEAIPISSWQDWKRETTARGLDVYVLSLGSWEYLEDAKKDPKCRVNAAKNSESDLWRYASVTIRGKPYHSGVYPCPVGTLPTPEYCLNMERLCRVLELDGNYPTPAAAGQAKMRQLCTLKVTSPSLACQEFVKEWSIGGRAEVFRACHRGDAYEVDGNSMHAAQALLPMPVGTATRLYIHRSLPPMDLSWVSEGYKVYFLLCEVTIRAPLRYGCFGVKQDGGHTLWPTAPGAYLAGLWDFQVKRCLLSGCSIKSWEGYAWTQESDILRPWAEFMWAKRQGCKEPAVRELIKQAIVGAIGYLAMSTCVGYVSESGTEPIGSGLGMDEARVKVEVSDAPLMPHWASRIWALTSEALLARMLREWESGNVIVATNFDSIILVRPSRIYLDPTGLGAWKQREIKGVRHIGPRQLVAEGIVKLPGVSLAMRISNKNILERNDRRMYRGVG